MTDSNAVKKRSVSAPTYARRETELRTADLKLNILKTVRGVECHGYEIHKKLASQGKEIEVGRLYKVLKDMLTEGALGCRWEKSDIGPEKRVYKLAEKGKKELDENLLSAIDTIHSHYSDYLLKLPTETSIFEGFAKMAAPEAIPQCKIAFYATRSSIIHEQLFTALKNRLPASELCAIHPREVILNLKNENPVSLQGDYSSIPLRANYVDLLIIEGLPNSKDSLKAVEEWHRVLKNNGRLVILAPRVIFSQLKDPLAIGDFMEKMEHQGVSKDDAGDGRILKQFLEKYFLKVQKKEILQTTFLIAFEQRALAKI